MDTSLLPELVNEAKSFLGGNSSYFRSRDIIVTSILLLYAPKCIMEGRRIPKGLARDISGAMEMNRCYLSRQVQSLSFRFAHLRTDEDIILSLKNHLLSHIADKGSSPTAD